MNDLIIVGGGLAGSEAARQTAKHSINEFQYEMRPNQSKNNCNTYLYQRTKNAIDELLIETTMGEKHEIS